MSRHGGGEGWASSREFLDLVKSIGECKSKSEEDRIMAVEVETLRKRLAQPDTPKRRMKELLVRLGYVEMLGHDASFGYIHAVKLANDPSLMLKKVGYLAVTLFLDENHELIILILNTVQRDLRSDNHLIVCTALNAICKLTNPDTIPAVLQPVVDLLSHPKEVVRKKAVMALQRFNQKAPHLVTHLIQRFRQALCDKDPSVMAAALCALHDRVVLDPASYKNLVPSFVSILKQIIEHRLPKAYDYHRTPAPFIQIKLLKVLAILGASDKLASENMYAVLADVLRRGDVGINIGNAIVYECVRTIASIYPNGKLLEAGAEVTSRFLKSDSHNLKYMGIDALGLIVKINPSFATEHQLAVIDCLEDPDETLRRKTLNLLYQMTKPSNVEVIVEKMLTYMRGTSDAHIKVDIVNKVNELAERFAPSNQWFIKTMNTLFELGGDLVKPEVAHNLMRLIAEGSGDNDAESDSELRTSAVDSYLELLDKPKLPSILLQVICWVLGEYGTLMGVLSAEELVVKLCDIADLYAADDTVKGYVITAITKVYAQQLAAGKKLRLSHAALSLVRQLEGCLSTDLQQRAYELQALTAAGDTLARVLPADASSEDIQVDQGLSFLNGYVQAALQRGAQPYVPLAQRQPASYRRAAEPSHAAEHALRFEAYENPMEVAAAAHAAAAAASAMAAISSMRDGGLDALATAQTQRSSWEVAPAQDASTSGSSGLRLQGVQRRWGPETFSSSANAASTSSATSSRPSSSDAPKPTVVTPTQSSRPASRPIEKTAEQLERERLAASLFGGGGSKPAEPSRTTKPRAAAKPTVAAKPAPVRSDMDFLMDLSDTTPAQSSASSSSALADPFQQLAGLSLAPTTAAPVSPPETRAATNSMDLSALYGLAAGPPAHVMGGLAVPTGMSVSTASKAPGVSTANPRSPLQRPPAGAAAQQSPTPSQQKAASNGLFDDLLKL
eukprot:jgi/Chlat1/4399/Chrsp29S04536